jgi:hypothetical protein
MRRLRCTGFFLTLSVGERRVQSLRELFEANRDDAKTDSLSLAELPVSG